jgi:hypothetical protein
METLSDLVVVHNLGGVLCCCERRADNLVGSPDVFIEGGHGGSGQITYEGKEYALFLENKDRGECKVSLYNRGEGSRIELITKYEVFSPAKLLEALHNVVTDCPYCSITEESYDL